MGRKKKYINLTEEQKAALELEYKMGRTHDYRKRCKCILLNAQGWTADQLVVFFSTSRQSIYKWIRRYESEGISGLKIRPGRGRKRKLDIDNTNHVAITKASLSKECRGIKQLKQQLESELRTTISDTTIRDFLKVLVTDTDVSGSALNPNRTQGRWVKK